MQLSIPRNPKYGWIPDIPDVRDYPYARLAIVAPPLPAYVDLRKLSTPIENQGTLGSCTACALVGNLEYLKKKSIKKNINFSKLFLYYNERLIRHTVKVDSGASLRDGIKTLVKTGDCLESIWPYKISKFTVRPAKSAYLNAEGFQITNYFRIYTLDEIKHTLSTGFPFVFGFAVYESFESSKVKETGIVPIPDLTERMVGGHAVCAVGYDDKKNWFIVRNSWGKSFGDNGYIYLPYTYLTNKFLSADFWTIRAME